MCAAVRPPTWPAVFAGTVRHLRGAASALAWAAAAGNQPLMRALRQPPPGAQAPQEPLLFKGTIITVDDAHFTWAQLTHWHGRRLELRRGAHMLLQLGLEGEVFW